MTLIWYSNRNSWLQSNSIYTYILDMIEIKRSSSSGILYRLSRECFILTINKTVEKYENRYIYTWLCEYQLFVNIKCDVKLGTLTWIDKIYLQRTERRICTEAQLLENLETFYGSQTDEETAEQIAAVGLPEDKYDAAAISIAVLHNAQSEEEKFVERFLWNIDGDSSM